MSDKPSAEERAHKIADDFFKDPDDDIPACIGRLVSMIANELEEAIADSKVQGAAEEREACAKIAERCGPVGENAKQWAQDLCDHIASKIRARANASETEAGG